MLFFAAPDANSGSVARQSIENGDFASEFSRAQILGALQRREAILHAASFVASCFLSGDWEAQIGAALERLGQTTDVSRVYLFEKLNGGELEEEPRFCQHYEWCAPGIAPEISNPALQNFSFESEDKCHWRRTLQNDAPVIGNVRDFNAAQPTLAANDVLSIALMPINVEGKWWGFLGFDECRRERDWDDTEIEALHLTANLLGAGIARGRATQASDKARREMRAIFGAMSDVIFVLDREGRYLKIVPTRPELLVKPSDELLGRTVSQVIGGEVAARFNAVIAQVLESGRPASLEYALSVGKKDKWFDATLSPLDENSVVCVARDVTESVRAREELRCNAALFHLLTENSIDVIAHYDLEPKILFISPSVFRMLGYRPEELIGKNSLDTVHPDDVALIRGAGQRLLADPSHVKPLFYRRRHRDGHYLWMESFSSAVCDEKGEVKEFHVVMRDVTERRIAEDKLQAAEARYRSIFENAVEGIFQTSPDGHYLTANPSLARIYGYESPRQLLGTLSDIARQLYVDIGKRGEFMNEMEKTGEVSNFEAQIHRKDGTIIWISENARAVRDERGKLLYYEGTVEDITARKVAQNQLIHDALHDRLTGLANRALFTDRLTQSFGRLKRHKDALFAVLFLDFDRFKNVNDSLGHMAGDQLLIEMASRLAHCLRPGDTVSRLGGDEFAILIEDVNDVSGATLIAERIHKAMALPFNILGQEVFSSASIGIALAHDEYEKSEDLLRDADMAMYRAKAMGKARHEVFDAGMHTRAIALLQLETDLRHAIERDEFELFYQPIVNLENGGITGFEALIRWQHPERGLVSPLDFIPIAEETGWIIPIGKWVLERACAQLALWQEQTQIEPPLTMSVNLSGKQFSHPHLVEEIRALLQKHALAPHCLKLEITESAIMEHAEVVTERLLKLREIGVRLGLDDFGTGYSSLSYLHRFPLDTLKIDRSFITRMLEGGENREIVKTIVALGKNLGMDVVAEGVETADQLADLRSLNCANGQGYLFAKPLPESAAFELLTRKPKW